MNERPNILLIMSDEHDPGVTGCYGDPLVATPNLNRLAAEGVRFDGCYTNSPLCVPARLSFTTGTYVSRCGAWNNTCRLPSDDIPSIARVLRDARYEALLCGKQHYDRHHRYGFLDILPEAGSNREIKRGLLERRAPDDWKCGRDWHTRAAEFYPADDSGIMSHDRKVTARTCAFLRNWYEGLGPFFLFAGHLAPHFPLIAPQAIYGKYRGRVPMPEIPEGFLGRLPLNYRQLRCGFGMENPPPEVVRLGRELYWALTDWYDQQVGEILRTLDELGMAENTIVIYTSDHGENKGDHGMWWKNNMYEHSARVPLIVRWPARWAGGQVRRGACSLLDVVQTIVELAGGRAPEDWNGDSMVRWLDDAQTPWKDVAVSEYYGHYISSGVAMIRRGAWKYVYHSRVDAAHGPERELYHLETEPKEFNNLAGDPAHRDLIAELHGALVKEIGEDPDETELRFRRERARPYDD